MGLKGICTMNMIWSEKMHFTMHILPLGFIFEKFSSLAKRPWKCHFFVRSLFLLLWLTFPPLLAQITSSQHSSWPLTHISSRRRKCEPEEEEIWGQGGGNMSRQKSPLCCRLAYGAKFSKINPSGNISDIKGIFWAHIMFMVHIPFKEQKVVLLNKYNKDRCIANP